MATFSFKDDKDGFYQVDVQDGEPLPGWTEGLTQLTADEAAQIRAAQAQVAPPNIRQQILAVSQQALASGFLHIVMFDTMTRYLKGVQDAVNAATPQGQTPPTITAEDLTNSASPYYSHSYVETKGYYDQLVSLQAQK